MGIDANAIFEDELTRRGLPFLKESENVYRFSWEGWTISANLVNVRRNAERDQDPDLIRRFVESTLCSLPANLPCWSDASKLLFFSAELAHQEFGDTVRTRATDDLSRVLSLTDERQTKITWVTRKMCKDWGVAEEAAIAAALANQDRLLEGIEIQIAGEGAGRIGMIPLASAYKASVIFAPAFKQFVEREFGWPVLVVVPCRDFLYVIADDSPLLPWIGPVVVEEFQNAGYPLTTEVLRLSDDGIEAIGYFPT